MKTMASVMIKRDLSVGNEDKFVEALFFERNCTLLRELAVNILRFVREHGCLPDKNDFKTSVNKKSYHNVLRKMKVLGIVQKHGNEYFVSKRFAENLRKLSDYGFGLYQDSRTVLKKEGVKPVFNEPESLLDEDFLRG